MLRRGVPVWGGEGENVALFVVQGSSRLGEVWCVVLWSRGEQCRTAELQAECLVSYVCFYVLVLVVCCRGVLVWGGEGENVAVLVWRRLFVESS